MIRCIHGMVICFCTSLWMEGHCCNSLDRHANGHPGTTGPIYSISCFLHHYFIYHPLMKQIKSNKSATKANISWLVTAVLLWWTLCQQHPKLTISIIIWNKLVCLFLLCVCLFKRPFIIALNITPLFKVEHIRGQFDWQVICFKWQACNSASCNVMTSSVIYGVFSTILMF